MRVLLFTGKGGVGKTTVAAGTAVLAAARGHKTLVLSTDAAHSLGDAFGQPVGNEPTELDDCLFAHQVDGQRAAEQAWPEISGYLRSVFAAGGVDPIAAEELAVLPGIEEVLALLAVREQIASGRFDVVVVDCGPTAETIRLLALPEALGWYMRRIFPMERRIVRSLRPVLSRVGAMPVPQDRVFAAVERLHAELAAVHAVLTDPRCATVRLVLTPEAVVVAEARRTFTSLVLYGYAVDAVVANRILPDAGGDAWRAGWVASQAAQLSAVRESFDPLPVLTGRYLPREPVGSAALAAFAAELYGARDPLGTAERPPGLEVERDGPDYVLRLPLPLADRSEVELARSGDELVVTVGGHRRLITLPSVLRRCLVTGAQLRAGTLRICFQPDPAQWGAP